MKFCIAGKWKCILTNSMPCSFTPVSPGFTLFVGPRFTRCDVLSSKTTGVHHLVDCPFRMYLLGFARM